MQPFAARSRRAALAALTLALAAPFAQARPDSVVKIVVPAPPGGVIDAIARVYGDFLAKETGQTVIIDNRPGAGGSIGVQAMLNAPPDGNTIAMINSNVLTETPHVVKPHYDPIKDVKPLAVLARSRAILGVSSELPVTDLASLAKYLKSAPGKTSFASPSPGTQAHFFGEMLNRRLDLDMTHVPFSGSPAALVAVMSGQVTMYFDSVVTSGPQVRAGKIKALAITGESRSAAFPLVPTFAEQGYPEFQDFLNFMGLVMSPKVPLDVADKLYAVTRKIAASPQFGAKLAELGFEPMEPTSPDQFARILASDYARNGELVRRLNVKL
jgi:tripartite-type tricarboxylate transporter receptor subunit TctC